MLTGEKEKYSKKTSFQCHVLDYNFHVNWPGIETHFRPGLTGWVMAGLTLSQKEKGTKLGTMSIRCKVSLLLVRY
jgi:hypothetical protein